MTGRLYSTARFCIRHRRKVVALWLLAAIAFTVASGTAGNQCPALPGP